MAMEVMAQTKMLLEGSEAVAEAVKLCRPNVICAYPITPQTHIVENLSQMVADGELKAEFINVESEHSAASACLGAVAAGARAYTSTSSQGFLLMLEVLYNIAGMRLPLVLTCANRAISAPINIWNDHQDSFAARDTGWIQLFAENNQELMDLHILAYRISQDAQVMLPAMVCMDGYALTHAYEPLWVPPQEEVDAFLPPYQPVVYLTPKDPLTLGALATPDYYMEARYGIQEAQQRALGVIEELAQEFKEAFGRPSGEILEEYFTDDASTIIVSLGSLAGTVKDAVDELRQEGVRVGGLKMRLYRPFPQEALRRALGWAERVMVLDKNISLGHTGALASELRAILYGQPRQPRVAGFIVGLGGRDITTETIKGLVARVEAGECPDAEFVDLKPENIWRGER